MAIIWETLNSASRLLLEARLQPVQGSRFQPTGFPDLGAATYDCPRDGKAIPMLLVESAQSMANRLETVCWDDARGDLLPPLRDMPYVRVRLWDSGQTTSSILEAHRLNSPYIMNDESFKDQLRKRANIPERSRTRRDGSENDEDSGGAGLFERRMLAHAAFHYDPCSVLHGVFLEKLDGRARLQRCLASFIEAANVKTAPSGGVKNDRVAQDPRALGFPQGQGAREGFGNVPFHRTEFTADTITAYFAIDLAQIRAYGLGDAADRFLITLALWKIRGFLERGLRLRTACDLEPVDGLQITRPAAFQVPELAELGQALPGLIQECASAGLFASPPVTELTFQPRGSQPQQAPRTGQRQR